MAAIWRHFGKSTERHNSVTGCPIRIKFSTSLQNQMPITTKSSKSKPGVGFPYEVPFVF